MIDGKNPDVVLGEMYELGMGEPLAIAAAHNRGVTALIEYVMEELHGKPEEPEADPDEWNYVWDEDEDGNLEEVVHEELDVKGIKIAVVGRPNVGKSTLVNRFLGEDRVVVYDEAGTTRDSVYIPYERHGQDYTLIDTAGVRRRKNISEAAEKFSIIKTLQAIQDCHVCILVLDARTGIVEQDLHMLSFVLNAGRALVIDPWPLLLASAPWYSALHWYQYSTAWGQTSNKPQTVRLPQAIAPTITTTMPKPAQVNEVSYVRIHA